MITPITRIAALLENEPVIIIGFDATHALIVRADGSIEYAEHRALRVVFYQDLYAGVWFEMGDQYGETEVGGADPLLAEGASESSDSQSRDDGRSDDDMAEPNT